MENACRFASCSFSGRLRPIAAFHASTENCKWRLNIPSSATLMLLLLGRPDSSIMRSVNQDAAGAQHPCIHRHLVGRDDNQEIRFSLRHHGAEDALAKPHIAGDGAAALAHPMQLALLHVQSGAEGNVGQNVGGLQHALTAQSRDHHVRRPAARRVIRLAAHCTSRTRGSSGLPAGSSCGRSPPRAPDGPGSPESSSETSAGSAVGSITYTFECPACAPDPRRPPCPSWRGPACARCRDAPAGPSWPWSRCPGSPPHGRSPAGCRPSRPAR